jgi:hypothetical protein
MKELNNLITGNNITDMELTPVIIRGFKLKYNHILIAFSHGSFFVKYDHGIFIYNTNEFNELYHINDLDTIINNLTIK